MGVDRFGTFLYGIGEAAGYLAVPPSTLATWAYGYERHRAGGLDASASQQDRHLDGSGATGPVYLLSTDGPNLPPLPIAPGSPDIQPSGHSVWRTGFS